MVSNEQTLAKCRTLEKTIIYFCAVCGVAGLFYQARALNQAHRENKALRRYADIAQNVALDIKPNTVDDFVYCDDAKCMTCRAVREGNKKAEKDYQEALNTLNIHPRLLDVLRQGPYSQ